MFVWDAFAATEQQLLRCVLCEDSFCQAENRVNLKRSLVRRCDTTKSQLEKTVQD